MPVHCVVRSPARIIVRSLFSEFDEVVRQSEYKMLEVSRLGQVSVEDGQEESTQAYRKDTQISIIKYNDKMLSLAPHHIIPEI